MDEDEVQEGGGDCNELEPNNYTVHKYWDAENQVQVSEYAILIFENTDFLMIQRLLHHLCSRLFHKVNPLTLQTKIISFTRLTL